MGRHETQSVSATIMPDAVLLGALLCPRVFDFDLMLATFRCRNLCWAQGKS